MYTTLAPRFLQRLNRLEILVRDACCAFYTNESSFWSTIALKESFWLTLNQALRPPNAPHTIISSFSKPELFAKKIGEGHRKEKNTPNLPFGSATSS